MLTKSKDFNPNYLAKICKVSNVRNHPNAEKLNLCSIDGYTVIIGKDVSEGDMGVFFPVECIINNEFLYFCNLYRNRDLNYDTEATPGFFEYKESGKMGIVRGGRVKAVKLRGVVSEGFWIEIDKFMQYLVNSGVGGSGKIVCGLEFDTIRGDWFVRKYEPQTNPHVNKNNKQGKKAKVSLIVPDQFRFHIDTEHLQRNMFNLNPSDICSITYKIHGCNAVSTNLLIKDQSLKGRIGRFLGVGGTKYDNVYSSRRVIKNGWAGMSRGGGYYDEDIWEKADKTLRPFLEKGLSFYYEISGFAGEQYIQKGFDYGCEQGDFNTHIFRITYTNVDGKVFEFSALQVQQFCRERGINAVPELYYGYVKNLFQLDYSDRDWRDKYLDLLRKEFVEGKMCNMCKNNVPAEGIVLRIDNSLTPKVFKLKNTEFLLRETKELDII